MARSLSASSVPRPPRRGARRAPSRAAAAALASLALVACRSPAPEPSAPAAAVGPPSLVAAASSATMPGPSAAAPGAAVGKPAPPFRLTDLDGQPFALSAQRGKVVVLEWFNPDCPFVRLNHTKGPLKDMARKAMAKGVVWVSINSSGPGKQGYGAERNRERKRDYAMANPILLDETGAVGHLYGAKTTPTLYIIDKDGGLAYAGAVDNAQDGDPPGGEAFTNYGEAALADLAAGRPVARPTVPSYGCSVKYAQ